MLLANAKITQGEKFAKLPTGKKKSQSAYSRSECTENARDRATDHARHHRRAERPDSRTFSYPDAAKGHGASVIGEAEGIREETILPADETISVCRAKSRKPSLPKVQANEAAGRSTTRAPRQGGITWL
jgi:hypothetical protein